jgi:hypothetical protein
LETLGLDPETGDYIRPKQALSPHVPLETLAPDPVEDGPKKKKSSGDKSEKKRMRKISTQSTKEFTRQVKRNFGSVNGSF